MALVFAFMGKSFKARCLKQSLDLEETSDSQRMSARLSCFLGLIPTVPLLHPCVLRAPGPLLSSGGGWVSLSMTAEELELPPGCSSNSTPARAALVRKPAGEFQTMARGVGSGGGL